MQAIKHTATEGLPLIDFDRDNGNFIIIGRSIPDDAYAFYEPIMQWVSAYVKSPNPTTRLICQLDYFNSATQKTLVEMFKLFMEVDQANGEFILEWRYRDDDEEALEIGQIFQNMLHLTVDFKVLENS